MKEETFDYSKVPITSAYAPLTHAPMPTPACAGLHIRMLPQTPSSYMY